MVAEAPSRSCKPGRKLQLTILAGLDGGVCYAIYYATTVQFVRANVSIAHATITLNSTYKILGISGGPIAGKINGYRDQGLQLLTWTWRGYAIAAALYFVSQIIEYYRRKHLKYEEDFRTSMFATLLRIFYFFAWCLALGVCMIGVVIWYMDWKDLSLYSASVDVKDGTKILAYAALVLLVIGFWRAIARGLRDYSSPIKNQKPDAEMGGYGQQGGNPQAMAAGLMGPPIYPPMAPPPVYGGYGYNPYQRY